MAQKVASLPRVVRLQRRGDRVSVGCDVYIGRRQTLGGWDLPQSKWADPFRREQFGGEFGSTLAAYEAHVRNSPELMADLESLYGKVLGCWCKPRPCHGDVLIKLLKEKEGQVKKE